MCALVGLGFVIHGRFVDDYAYRVIGIAIMAICLLIAVASKKGAD